MDFGSEEDINGLLEKVAQKHLDIASLETQNNIELDYHSVAVWQLKKALREAYNLGMGDIRLHKRV